MTREDAVETSTPPKMLGLKELGRMARSLDISRLGTEPKSLPKIDKNFTNAGGNMALFAQKMGISPLAAARMAVDVGLVPSSDARCAAALDAKLEKRDGDFVKTMTKSSTIVETAKEFANDLREAGSRQGFLQMKAVSLEAEKGSAMNAGSMAVALEGATSGDIPSKLREKMLLSSARFGDADHLQRQQSREKSEERNGVAR
jgi:hypothetical protein